MHLENVDLKHEIQSSKEDEKILEFVREYRDLLIINHIDVAQSTLEKTWFVYRYEKRYGYYEKFFRFFTVSQLVDMIIHSNLGKNSKFFQLLNDLCEIKEDNKDGKGTL